VPVPFASVLPLIIALLAVMEIVNDNLIWMLLLVGKGITIVDAVVKDPRDWAIDGAVIDPVVVKEVAEASPRLGVDRVGEVERTTEPVPVDVVEPVPPFKTGRAVPERVIASVPEEVIGPPAIERNATAG